MVSALQAFYAYNAAIWEAKYGSLGCTAGWCSFDHAVMLAVMLTPVAVVGIWRRRR
jgi:uncharacterized membrane protein